MAKIDDRFKSLFNLWVDKMIENNTPFPRNWGHAQRLEGGEALFREMMKVTRESYNYRQFRSLYQSSDKILNLHAESGNVTTRIENGLVVDDPYFLTPTQSSDLESKMGPDKIEDLDLSKYTPFEMNSDLRFFLLPNGEGTPSGSFVVLTGDPGSGKTTFQAEWSKALAEVGNNVIFCHGEMSKIRVLKQGQSDPALLYPGVNKYNFKDGEASKLPIDKALIYLFTKNERSIIFMDSFQEFATELQIQSEGQKTFKECEQWLINLTLKSLTFGNTIVWTQHVNKNGNYKGSTLLIHRADSHYHITNTQGNRAIIARKTRDNGGTEYCPMPISKKDAKLVFHVDQYLAFLKAKKAKEMSRVSLTEAHLAMEENLMRWRQDEEDSEVEELDFSSKKDVLLGKDQERIVGISSLQFNMEEREDEDEDEDDREDDDEDSYLTLEDERDFDEIPGR